MENKNVPSLNGTMKGIFHGFFLIGFLSIVVVQAHASLGKAVSLLETHGAELDQSRAKAFVDLVSEIKKIELKNRVAGLRIVEGHQKSAFHAWEATYREAFAR